jgi:hypothetical protein
MTTCRDFFVLVYKDATVEYWEFDHAGWKSPPESARFQMRVDKAGTMILMGVKDEDTQEVMWMPDDEPWMEFEDAALNCIERYFAQDCVANRYDSQYGEDTENDLDFDESNEFMSDTIDMSPGDRLEVVSVREWLQNFDGRPISTDDKVRRPMG